MIIKFICGCTLEKVDVNVFRFVLACEEHGENIWEDT